MVDSGTAAPELAGFAAASTTFQLEVQTLAGGYLATIPKAHGSWQLHDVVDKLPRVLPGKRYQLVKGEAVLAPWTAIAEWARPVDGRACITAVVASRTREERRRLDAALLDAAAALDVEKVQELLLSGADARSRRSVTALHMAVEAPGPHRPRDGQELQAVVGVLLCARANVNAPRQEEGVRAPRQLEGNTIYPLHSAVRGGNLEVVRMLLDARASVDAVAKQRCSPEDARAIKGIVKPCCPFGRSGGTRSEFTALHAAMQAGHVPLVELLVERGADVSAVRQFSQEECRQHHVLWHETAMQMAVAGGHQALVGLFVRARAGTSIARPIEGEDSSVEELCAGSPAILGALQADFSDILLAGHTSPPAAAPPSLLRDHCTTLD